MQQHLSERGFSSSQKGEKGRKKHTKETLGRMISAKESGIAP